MIAGYVILAGNDEDGERMTAYMTDGGPEIAGAYRPGRLNDWRIYISKVWSDRTGLEQPHKVHTCSAIEARKWVEMLAYIYTTQETS